MVSIYLSEIHLSFIEVVKFLKIRLSIGGTEPCSLIQKHLDAHVWDKVKRELLVGVACCDREMVKCELRVAHSHSLMRVFAVRLWRLWILGYPQCPTQTLIRLSGCLNLLYKELMGSGDYRLKVISL